MQTIRLYFTSPEPGFPAYVECRVGNEPAAIEYTPPSLVKEKTKAEELRDLIYEYYSYIGKPVPEEDKKWCEDEIAREEYEKLHPPPPPPPPPPAKPSYGTPEFWKDYWKRRKAAEAAGEPWPPKKSKKKS